MSWIETLEISLSVGETESYSNEEETYCVLYPEHDPQSNEKAGREKDEDMVLIKQPNNTRKISNANVSA